MDQVIEFKTESYRHSHSFSLRALTWATLAITAVMGVLFFAVGFPPAFDTFYEKMYFHAIGIGIAALAVYLILETFKLEAYEPPLDFPIRYRAILAVAFGAIGGLIALNPSVWRSLPQIGMVFFTISFVLIFDVGAALLVELFVMPRKKAGVYTGTSRSIIDYIWRIVPLTAADRAAYRGVGAAYWLTIGSLASACAAMVIGFVNLWVRAFGPSIFGAWYAGLGLDKGGILDATLDPHSHMIAIAIVAMTVAVAVIRFGALAGEPGLRRILARAGTWIALVGVVLTTLVLGAVAFLNYAPPTLFTSGPDGVNGIAGDDLIMTIVFVGAMVVATTVVSDRRFWHDGLRLTILGTWAASVAITVIEGIYIELHEAQFGGALAANDAAFSSAHPMTGIFLMLVLSLALLVVDTYGVPGRLRRIEVGIGATGLVAAFAGTTLWTFSDPSNGGPAYGLYVAGIAISYLAVLGAGLVVRGARTQGVHRTTA
jgi:hypothetical protein